MTKLHFPSFIFSYLNHGQSISNNHGILIMRLVGVNEIKGATSLHTSIDVRKRNKLHKRRYGELCCGLMRTKISSIIES